MLDTILAWVNAVAGIVLLLAIAGPGSIRPFSERLLLWGIAVSFIGASAFRIVDIYDPSLSEHATVVSYVVMIGARLIITVVAVYLSVLWAFRYHPEYHTPAEICGDFLAGHRR